MAKPPRDRIGGEENTFFITTSVWQGRALFQSHRMARLFLECMFNYRDLGKYSVHEFAVMPNHVHALITPRECLTIERAVQFIKGGFSHQVGRHLNRNIEIWQRGFVDHRIRGVEDYAYHVKYIRENPVRAGMCLGPELYEFSSAHQRFQLDEPPQRLKPVNLGALFGMAKAMPSR